MKALVLGAGKMVEAILIGLKEKMNLSDWGIYSPSGISSKKLAEMTGAVQIKTPEDMSSFDFDFVLIGCKPQQLKNLASSLLIKFDQKLIVSMLAAICEREQRKILRVDKLVRIMPNLPVKYHAGVTLISSQSASMNLPQIQDLFNLLGSTLIVQENELDELTLLTGSGPALFYEFTRSLANCFKSWDENKRESLARLILHGSGIYAQRDTRNLDEIIGSVTSRGGVTIEVLQQWRKHEFHKLIEDGVSRGKLRGEDINKLLMDQA